MRARPLPFEAGPDDRDRQGDAQQIEPLLDSTDKVEARRRVPPALEREEQHVVTLLAVKRWWERNLRSNE